jgi:hypothetical protein
VSGGIRPSETRYKALKARRLYLIEFVPILIDSVIVELLAPMHVLEHECKLVCRAARTLKHEDWRALFHGQVEKLRRVRRPCACVPMRKCVCICAVTHVAYTNKPVGFFAKNISLSPQLEPNHEPL